MTKPASSVASDGKLFFPSCSIKTTIPGLHSAIKILFAIVCFGLSSPLLSQNCNVDFPGIVHQKYSAICGGNTGGIMLGKNTGLSDGDVFTFDTPVVNIKGNIDVNVEGSGKIVIPSGVTVNLEGHLDVKATKGTCTPENPCALTIEVNGIFQVSKHFSNDIFTIVWSGTGIVTFEDNVRNTKDACMSCGPSGCPQFEIEPADCRDDGSGCTNGGFCAMVAACASDITSPVISGCPTDLVLEQKGTSCSSKVTWIAPNVKDNCTIASFTSSHKPGDTFPQGTTTVAYTATDAAGNSSRCSFTITILDKAPPVLSRCPKDITAEAHSTCDTPVTWLAPTATDNCDPSPSITSKFRSGDIFPIGTTQVKYQAMDASGNVATCSSAITIVDKVAPVILGCPQDITVDAGSDCSTSVRWLAPTAKDNCGSIPTLKSNFNPGDVFPVGKTEVKYEATDAAGNTSSCSFHVTVMGGSVSDLLICPQDILIEGTTRGGANVWWEEPDVSTYCGNVKISRSHNPGDLFPYGTTEVMYTITNDAGYESRCSFNVTVSPPAINIQVSQIVTPDGNGINDFWMITDIEKFNDNSVTLVDRWGSVVFNARHYDNERIVWRGTGPGGKTVPTGTYFYLIVINTDLSKSEWKGFIEVVK